MSLEICVLGSGSAGNSTVARGAGGAMLIDAGLGPRTLAARLVGTGLSVADLGAICLTHLDRDHFSPAWTRTIINRQIRVFCHAGRAADLIRIVATATGPHVEADRFAALVREFDDEPFAPLDGLTVTPIPLAHDAAGSHGFVLDDGAGRVGYATDLGRVPADLLARFCDLDVLAIESNYDAAMQLASDRPTFLKHRIMGGRGHLSNAQALAAVRQLFDACTRAGRPLPAHVVLLHRSRQCNCPDLLRATFARDARIAPRLTLAHQHARTDWLATGDRQPLVGEQLSLAWG